MLSQFLFVALGGAIGASARFAVGLLFAAQVGTHWFPFATLVINIAGSVLIGALWANAGATEWFEHWGRALLVTGVLGGFTTFSAFSLETVNLLSDARYFAAGFYIAVSLAACLIGCWLGYRWFGG